MKLSVFEVVFFCGFLLIPLALVSGSIVSYADIKICLLMVVSASCAFHLVIKRDRIKINSYLILVGLLLLIRAFTFGPIVNLGLQVQSFALTLSVFVICLWIYNNKVAIKVVPIIVVPGVVCAIANSLSMYFYRTPLFSTYSPFGAPIGLKNSLSVYLAQVVPIFLLGFLYLSQQKKAIYKILKLLIVLLITTSLWVVFSNRTRSAWWMIACIFLVLTLCAFKRSKKLRGLEVLLGCCVVSAVLLTVYVPNLLKWHSNSPYLDSLKSMLSLEKSNGRGDLWKVGVEIIGQNPIFGIGTGNYSTLWQSYIKDTSVPAKTFRFLRADLPIFNDYLQASIENGLIGGCVFFLLFFLYPFSLLRKAMNKPEDLLLLLVCLCMVVDAMFDYPFNRSENVVIYALSFALVLKSVVPPVTLNNRSNIVIKVLLSLGIAFSAVTSIRLAEAVYYRREFQASSRIEYLKKAWLAWPWDLQWDSWKIERLWHAGERELAEDLASRRLQYWPNDPESSLMNAIVAENKSQHADALFHYANAINQVEDGRCYYPALKRYQIFSKKNKIGPTDDMTNKLKNCGSL